MIESGINTGFNEHVTNFFGVSDLVRKVGGRHEENQFRKHIANKLKPIFCKVIKR